MHAGEEKRKPYGALTTPIVQTSTYTFADTAEILDFMHRKAAGEPEVRDEYGRYSNPTQTRRRAQSRCPGGRRAGPALCQRHERHHHHALLALLSSGDHLILARDCYHRTREFALTFLGRWGIETTLVPIDDPRHLPRPSGPTPA